MAFLPELALAASVAGPVLGGISSASSANYQSQVAKNNATIARQNEGYAAGAGSAQVQQAGLKARAQGAEIRTGLAANGLDVNSGSSANVQESARDIGKLDTATVANRAAAAVYGYASQAQGFTAQSRIDSAQAGWDLIGGITKGIGAGAGGSADFPGGGGGGVTAEQAGSLLSGPSMTPSSYQWMGSTGGGPSVDEILYG